jgi:ABC-type nitrate/sulfonate/bicarbonate transport system substrate-binding protein
MRRIWTRLWVAAMLAALAAGMAHAADHILGGTLGGQAPLWPFYIAKDKGFLAAQGIDLDLSFSPNPAQVIQQLSGGSIDVAVSTGADGPIQAVDKGAPLAIVRMIGKNPAYALIGKPAIKSLADLKGKTIAAGSPVDITSIYLERMMAAVGLKKGDYDTLSFGVAAARYAALQAGEADAAMVLPPINFRAEKAGFPTIALPVDYVHDLPFTVMAVARPWAETHKDAVRRLIAATDQSVAWFDDPANREAAIAILVNVGKADRADAEASYAFLKRIDFFAKGHAIPRASIEALIMAERERGLVGPNLTADKLALSGVTELTSR